MIQHEKIFVAGARGMVGSAIVRRLEAGGYRRILAPARKELDLLDMQAVRAYLEREKPDYIFIAAAKVGGIQANNTLRADFIYQNLMIEANLIHAAHMADVQRLMFLGSSCIYPRDCPQPIREEYLLTGPLEHTNEPYAIAKIAGIKLCESYNLQYGRQYVSVMPTNLYGPGDNYDLAGSHVLPALIRKCHLARLALEGRVREIEADEAARGAIPDELLITLGMERAGDRLRRRSNGPATRVQIWGSGTPRREFLYVDDLADACIALMEHEYDGPLVNLGWGDDLTIRELAETVSKVIGFEGELVFDANKPDGTPRKLLDVSRMRALGLMPKVALLAGIERSYVAYRRFA
ncbi:MAG: GDP-fucose synthetase [Noviherbaspirillum sp.]|nr:GDP-fucose synthetase [Noviherbaspirillum sp.]